MELERATQDQAIYQKQLEQARKQNRQHQMLTQEYRSKQQVSDIVLIVRMSIFFFFFFGGLTSH